MTFVYDRMAPAGRRIVLYLTGAIGVVLLVAVIWFTVELTRNEFASGIRSYALGVPGWIYSIGLPVGFALVLIRFVQAGLEERRELNERTGRGRD